MGRLGDFHRRLSALDGAFVVAVGHGQFFRAYLWGRDRFAVAPEVDEGIPAGRDGAADGQWRDHRAEGHRPALRCRLGGPGILGGAHAQDHESRGRPRIWQALDHRGSPGARGHGRASPGEDPASASATPTCTPPTATGRSNRSCRSSPAMRASALSPRVGTGVNDVKEGDRVGVPWLHTACGHCEHCITGWETLCASSRTPATPSTAALPNTCWPTRLCRPPAGQPRFRRDRAGALRRRHRLQGPEGDRHQARRLGRDLGHRRARPLAVQYARAMGLHVAAVDSTTPSSPWRAGCGATVTVNAMHRTRSHVSSARSAAAPTACW